MNRFGLRLAAGLVVVCVGGWAMYQTQKENQSELSGSWPDPTLDAADVGPAPMPADSLAYPEPPDMDTVVRGNNDAFSGQDGFGVQQASYNEFAAPAAGNSGPSTSNFESNTTPVGSELAGGELATAVSGPALQPLQEESAPGLAYESSDANAVTDATDSTDESFALPPLMSGQPETESTAPSAEPTSAPASTLEMPSVGTVESAASTGPGTFDSSPASSQLTLRGADQSAASSGPTAAPSVAASQPAQDNFAPPSLGNFNSQAGAEPADPIDAAAANWGTGNASPTSEIPTLDQENQPIGSGLAGTGASSAAESTAAPTANSGLQPLPQGFSSPIPSATPPSGAGSQVNNTTNTTPRLPTANPQIEAANAPELRTASTAPLSNAALAQPRTYAGQATGAAIETVDPSEILAQPGTRDLEGTQAPQLLIEKIAPSEIRVGKPTDFTLQVRNVGDVPALDVRVFDAVPTGTELVEAVPSATPVSGLLTWQLGDLAPGEERSIVVRLVPLQEGEVGSVARVTFEAAASMRSIATQPKLELTQNVPPQVLIGQQLEIDIALANAGSGTARGVLLTADIPDGLEHVSGRQLELPIGELPPGSRRNQVMRLRATKPGVIRNTIMLVDSEGMQTTSTVDIEVVAPSVQLALDGPSLRYLERQATYDLQIANAGTADASNIEIVAFLDKGLKFVSTEAQGQYDPQRHAVFWSLAELPAGKNAEVPLTLLPVQPGQQTVRLEANADLGLAAANTKDLTIDTLAELSFTITDDQDPIEVGSDTIYEIRVQNTGTRDDTNVRLEVLLPHPAVELVTADPAAQTDGRGRVVFNPIATLPAKGEQVFQVRVRGNTADTHLIKAQVVSDQSKRPVTKEESTTIYSDK